MVSREILIAGGGLAGLSVAWHLQHQGVACEVLEKEFEVGGLCRSKSVNGFIFDHDGHLLHFKRRYTFNLVQELLKENLAEHKRNAWVYAYGRFVHYPFQANLYGLPADIVKECLAGFIAAREKGPAEKNGNFLHWINATFGQGIAKHFMIPYNTKFWTVPPQQITCAWLQGFIPQPTLDQVIAGTVEEGHEDLGYNVRFWYPKKGGIDVLAKAFESRLKNIKTNCAIQQVDIKHKTVVLSNGETKPYDRLVSTMPLPALMDVLSDVPRDVRAAFRKLRWNSVFNLNLGVQQEQLSDKHWIYFPQPEVSFFRVGFAHNFSAHVAPRGCASLYTEVSYSAHQPLDRKNIVSRIKEDLKKCGIMSARDKILAEDINDIPYGYPIYDRHYADARAVILKFLGKNHIVPCGRYGSWQYMSMEDVILEGREAAEVVCG